MEHDDIVKIELPAYQEDGSAIPDVEPESSFAENKDEIYRRNMIIAAKEAKPPVQRVTFPDNFDAEEIFPRREKRSGRGGFLRNALRFLDNNQGLKLVYSMLLITFIVVMTVLLSFTFRLRGGRVTDGPREVSVQIEEGVELTMTVQFEDVTAVTEILEEQVTEVIPSAVTVVTAEESVLY